MIDGQSTSLKLNGQQQALFKALLGKHQILSNIYIGVLTTMDHVSNPDRLPLAAHGARELMEKIPAFLDVSITAQTETLKTKVRELEDCWQVTVKRSQCHGSQGWCGQIDKSLSKLLERLQSFFKWFVEHHPRRKAEIASIERLVQLAPKFPHLSVECLRLMIEGDKQGWGVYGWTEEAQTIITEALGSEDEEAASAAINLIHILGARGFFDFRDLLPKKEVYS